MGAERGAGVEAAAEWFRPVDYTKNGRIIKTVIHNHNCIKL